MRRAWSRRPRHAGPSSAWRSAAISTPCWRATARCANTCRPSWRCRSRPPSAARPLLAAIGILRELDAGTRGMVEPDDPHGFVPAAWRPYLVENGKIDRRIWEISLAFAMRDALCGPAICSWPQSREHVSFWNLVHDERRWQESARTRLTGHLGLPTEPRPFSTKLVAALDQAARAAARGLAAQLFRRGSERPAEAEAVRRDAGYTRRCDSCARPSRPACRAYGSRICCRMSTNGAASRAPSSRSAAMSLARRRLPSAARHPHRPRHQSRPRRHEPERRQRHGRAAAGHQSLVSARGDTQGGQHDPGRPSPRAAVQPGLGRRRPVILRRSALRRRARQPARRLLSSLFRLLRPGARALHAHLRSEAASTPRARSPVRRARRITCSTAFSRTTPFCGFASTRPTPAASPSTCSACASCSASTSCRG